MIPLDISESNIREITHLVFPMNEHSKLAHSAVEFFLQDNDVNLDHLARFINFLIKNKNYN